MGEKQRSDTQRKTGSNKPGWRPDDPGSSDNYRKFLEGGKATRFKQKYPPPGAGVRFGQLTVINTSRENGRVRVEVQCDCGAESHKVEWSNLRAGKTTRCNACAKIKSLKTKHVKYYWKYADALPDKEHRRRLLNRLSAAIGRCTRPNNKQYPNYGGRGIKVCDLWVKDKAAFLRHVVTIEGWDDPKLEMDRADVNGDYEPGNIRFITKSKNALNKRSVQEMQSRIDELERRLRHCKCGATKPFHDKD